MDVTPESLDQRCRYPESNDLSNILYGVDDVCHSEMEQINEYHLADLAVSTRKPMCRYKKVV